MNYQATIELAVSPEKTFSFLADPKLRQEWMQKGFGARYTVYKTEYPDGFDEARAVGTKFVDIAKRTTGNLEAHLKGEITRYERPSQFEFKTEVPFNSTSAGGPESATRTITTVNFKLEPTGSGGTRLTWTMTDETVNSFGFLNWPLTKLIESYMNAGLKALKVMAEK